MVTHPETMKFGTKFSIGKVGDLNVFLNDHRLKEVTSYKYLGVYVDSLLNWSTHFEYLCKRIYPKLKLLNRLSGFLSPNVLLKIYKVTIKLIFDYGCIV